MNKENIANFKFSLPALKAGQHLCEFKKVKKFEKEINEMNEIKSGFFSTNKINKINKIKKPPNIGSPCLQKELSPLSKCLGVFNLLVIAAAIGAACLSVSANAQTVVAQGASQASNSSNSNNATPRLNLSALTSVTPDRLSIRIFYNNSTFENLFYKNLLRELEIEKEKIRMSSANIMALAPDINVTKYQTNMKSRQVNEGVEIGLADLTLLPLSAYQERPSNTLDLLDYPFMFSNLQQIQKNYFSAANLLFPELNARSPYSIPVAVMPSGFRVYAVKNDVELNSEHIKNDAVLIEDSAALQKTYAYFKKTEAIRTSDKIMPSAKIIETSVLDYYDKRQFETYKTVYLSNHSIKSYVLVISKKWWANLLSPQKDMVMQALARSVTKTTEEVVNFNSTILANLENQGLTQLKKVDYTTDFAALRQELSSIHYASAQNQTLIQMYSAIRKP